LLDDHIFGGGSVAMVMPVSGTQLNVAVNVAVTLKLVVWYDPPGLHVTVCVAGLYVYPAVDL